MGEKTNMIKTEFLCNDLMKRILKQRSVETKVDVDKTKSYEKDEDCSTAGRRVVVKATTEGPGCHMVFLIQGTSPDSITSGTEIEKHGLRPMTCHLRKVMACYPIGNLKLPPCIVV